jgi:hypothetical protein
MITIFRKLSIRTCALPKDMLNKNKVIFNHKIYNKTVSTLDSDTLYKIQHIFQTFDPPTTDHQKRYIHDLLNHTITEKKLTNDQITYLIFILKYYECI